ncbi:MAG: hypothetical protein IJI68_03305, partial [Eggerthellaceae bacterium]|nr:hypothetical protein [Eggerthellaceae bacterium]
MKQTVFPECNLNVKKDLIAQGAIGRINAMIGNCQGCKPSKDWQSQYEGPLLHDATHLFDIMRY